MLRMILLLGIGIYASLMIAGEDRGQLRPGLAAAALNPRPADLTETTADDSKADTVAVAAPPASSSPRATVAEPTSATAATADAMADPPPAPREEPVRTVVTEVKEPVFSLSSIGNETVPGTPVRADAPAAPELADGGEGTIWYVNASSVNVRAEPSTEAEIVGRLGSGEATLMVQAVNTDWARIVIQGDGVEGFVALRYLSPEAP